MTSSSRDMPSTPELQTPFSGTFQPIQIRPNTMNDSGHKKMKPPPILPPPITVDFSHDDDDIQFDNGDDDPVARLVGFNFPFIQTNSF